VPHFHKVHFKLVGIAFIVRDANHFHHFRDWCMFLLVLFTRILAVAGGNDDHIYTWKCRPS
jgi:hypothetical protein